MKSPTQASLRAFTVSVTMLALGLAQPNASVATPGKVFTDANSIRNLSAAEAARK